MRAVEHASIVISLELLRMRTAAEVEHRLRGELLADLLGGGSAMSEQVLQRAQRLGHDLTRPHVMIVGALSAAVTSLPNTRIYQRSLSLGRRPGPALHTTSAVGHAPGQYRHHVADRGDEPGRAIESGDAAAALVQRAMGSVARTVDATVAVSAQSARRRAPSYAEAYRTAKGALDIAVRAGRTNTVVQPG